MLHDKRLRTHPCIKIFLLTGGVRSGTLTSGLLIHAFYKNTKCKNESFIIPQYHLQRSARTEIRMCLMRNEWLVMLIMYRSRTKTTNLTNPPTRYLLTYNSNQTLPWTYRTASVWSVNMLSNVVILSKTINSVTNTLSKGMISQQYINTCNSIYNHNEWTQLY